MRLPSFLRPDADSQVEEELKSHMQHRADDLERSGLNRAEAERRARIEFGSAVRYQQESYEASGSHFLETLWQDVRYALRMLRKAKNFTAVAVITLALGIGANAVVFGIMNAIVLRPLNLPQADKLFMIERLQPATDQETEPLQSYPDYRDLRDRNRAFDGIAAFDIAPAGLDSDGSPSPTWLFDASGNYFDVVGVKPYLGRFFHSYDEHGPNSAPYIVLSYAYWQSHFKGDRGVVGRTVQLNKHPYTILGVAPAEFRGTELYFNPDFWVPMVNTEQVSGDNDLELRDSRSIFIVGRVKANVSSAQAASDLNSIAAYLDKTYPKLDGQAGFSLARPGLLGNMLGRPVRAFLAGLLLLAGLILLATCANLGSLFAARATDRSKELALRLALGSSRRRILRQLLTEAVVVSLLGGAVGVLCGVMLLHWLSAWQPVTDIPINIPVHPDIRVYAVSLFLSVASGLLFGIVPVRQVLRVDPYHVVKSGSTEVAGRRVSLPDILLVLQIAVCAVLVTSSLVAVRGMVRSLHSNFGFEPHNAILAYTDLVMAGYNHERVPAMQRRMLDTLGAIPGVTSAGLTDRLPLAMDWNDVAIYKDSQAERTVATTTTESGLQNITPGYLHAAGTTLLAGRDFTWHDDASSPRVAIVNREFARKVFGHEDSAVGSYFRLNDGTRILVVGLTEDGKYKTITEDQQAGLFMPILQSPSSSTWLVVRTSGDPQPTAAAMRQALRKLDPSLPVTVKTWRRQLDSALFASRVAAASLGVLGFLGALLAGTGIFGMASYSVTKRLRELGVRIALGAQRSEVLKTALGRASRLLAIGSVAGLVLGLLSTNLLSLIVYQATPRDPWVLAGVVLAMLILGLVATWLPAQRALSADPLMLLREQ
jgi:predicted permease